MRLKSARRRVRKLLLHASGRPKVPVFVVGCQRSGTTMLLRVLSRAPECRVFHENNGEAFDAEWRLRDAGTIRRLIEESPESVVIFKPLLDSQHTSRLLSLHPHARAIWLYRHYRDVVGSGTKEWGGDQRDIMWGIASDALNTRSQQAIREGMSEETVDLVRSLCNGKKPSAEDGALLHWYVRNLLYSEIQADPRVLLVKYEDLVGDPVVQGRRIFDFVGARFSADYVGDVRASSVGKHSGLKFDPRIQERCEDLLRALDARRSKDGRIP